jgi:hypothetical protein
MSLYLKAAQHITAQCQYRLEALTRSAPCIERLERLIEKLSRQGVDAIPTRCAPRSRTPATLLADPAFLTRGSSRHPANQETTRSPSSPGSIDPQPTKPNAIKEAAHTGGFFHTMQGIATWTRNHFS